MALTPFPILPSQPPQSGSATYVMLEVEEGQSPPEYIQGFSSADGVFHPGRRRFDGHGYVPAPGPNLLEQYDQ